MKGQVFTLDALLSLLVVTAFIGIVTMQFGSIYATSSDINAFEKQALADDWSQIAVRNVLLINNYSSSISTAGVSNLEALMDGAIGDEFDYEVDFSDGVSFARGDCFDNNEAAVSVRQVLISGTQGNITVKICNA